METVAEERDVVTLPEEDETDAIGLGKGEQKHRFVMLRAKGYSYARIAGELGVSKGTLTAWNAELEAEVAKSRAMELEALQEEFFLLKEGRIRLIGEQLKAIQTEIGKRDLSKVNTERLLELQLRYFGELKGEYVEAGQRTKTGPKLNSSAIAEQLQCILTPLSGRGNQRISGEVGAGGPAIHAQGHRADGTGSKAGPSGGGGAVKEITRRRGQRQRRRSRESSPRV